MGQTSDLAVFHPLLDIPPRGLDQIPECGVIGRIPGRQLQMPHAFPIALEQPCRVRQRRAVKEPHVRVPGKHIHVPERRISEARHRTPVVQQLPHLVAALAHRVPPRARHRTQLPRMLLPPRFDRRVALDRSVEAKYFLTHQSPHSPPPERRTKTANYELRTVNCQLHLQIELTSTVSAARFGSGSPFACMAPSSESGSAGSAGFIEAR